MSLVSINVYDITNTPNAHANEAIKALNRVTRDAFSLGGIFHGAVEVFGEEWSFGYCPTGTGVYSCAPRSNPNYTYRESLALGVTSVTPGQLRRCVEALQDDWPGGSYDLLSRNCNTFCDALCAALGVGPPPAWVNRFAQQGDELRRMYETGAETLSTATTWLRDRLTFDPALPGGRLQQRQQQAEMQPLQPNATAAAASAASKDEPVATT